MVSNVRVADQATFRAKPSIPRCHIAAVVPSILLCEDRHRHESSKFGYRIWAIASYLLTTRPKGISSVQLAKDLGITQKSAWHLAHRIRES